MAIITPALAAARTSLNRRFPGRDRTSDGWIGDEAHQGSRSGHNPDETGNAEYRDDDNVDEVRAVDLDADLGHPSLTMRDVVAAILATPADRDRCSYLIFDRTIWSRSAGYQPRRYGGSNPHTTHLHISGRPVNDDDDRPWLSIEQLGMEDDVSAQDVWRHRWPKIHRRDETTSAEGAVRWIHKHVSDTRGDLAEIRATLDVLAGRDVTDAVRAELGRHRAELLAELTEGLPDALADRLSEVPAEQVRQAVAEVLRERDRRAAGDDVAED